MIYDKLITPRKPRPTPTLRLHNMCECVCGCVYVCVFLRVRLLPWRVFRRATLAGVTYLWTLRYHARYVKPNAVVIQVVARAVDAELRHVRFVCVIGNFCRCMWVTMLFSSLASNVLSLDKTKLYSCVFGEQNVNTM